MDDVVLTSGRDSTNRAKGLGNLYEVGRASRPRYFVHGADSIQDALGELAGAGGHFYPPAQSMEVFDVRREKGVHRGGHGRDDEDTLWPRA